MGIRMNQTMIIKPILLRSCCLLFSFGILFIQHDVFSQEPFVSTANNSNSVVEQPARLVPTILFESIVIFDENDLIPLLPNIYQIGNFKYELTPGALSAFYLPQSASGERIYKLVQEQGIDGYKISDGSMLIEYMEGTDTAAIANDFSLELILDFPSVRTASFQASTFSGLNELMSTLTEDDRINLVSLDLIDPSIGPR
tara:strand:- start:2004 stop:2600 length:597 start_codon:yes stop_codon:yes gene_type:complete